MDGFRSAWEMEHPIQHFLTTVHAILEQRMTVRLQGNQGTPDVSAHVQLAFVWTQLTSASRTLACRSILRPELDRIWSLLSRATSATTTR